jgi:subtilase family serine protease
MKNRAQLTQRETYLSDPTYLTLVESPTMRLLAPRHVSRSSTSVSNQRRTILQLEVLEDRRVLSTFMPSQIGSAYGFSSIKFGNVKGNGTGQTVAIVDAYSDPNIVHDLEVFDAQFGLSNNDGTGKFALTVAQPQGAPTYSEGWAEEITLDVEWVHAVAPGAHIELVEAANSSYADLFGGIAYANGSGASVVSMSWGSGEFAGESAYDSYFTKAGVAYVASAGDTGGVTEYPAVSPNVLSVGGTSLYLNANGTYNSETTWTGSGGGISLYESKPSFQSGVTQSSTKRTSPDVAFDANPYTGVYVYFTPYGSTGNWYAFGGTSVGAPVWSAMIAIADQGRVAAGEGTLSSSQLLKGIYNLPASDFHDVTSGTASSSGHSNSAGTGYDLVTGRGSPVAQNIVQGLVSLTVNGTLPAVISTTPASGPSVGAGKNDLLTLIGPPQTNDNTFSLAQAAATDVAMGSSTFDVAVTYQVAENGPDAAAVSLQGSAAALADSTWDSDANTSFADVLGPSDDLAALWFTTPGTTDILDNPAAARQVAADAFYTALSNAPATANADAGGAMSA